MKGFGYGNEQDVILLQQNNWLIILATFYLIWRIISGLWYTWISLSAQIKKDEKIYIPSNPKRSIIGILTYTIIKLFIWVLGLRAILFMVFTS